MSNSSSRSSPSAVPANKLASKLVGPYGDLNFTWNDILSEFQRVVLEWPCISIAASIWNWLAPSAVKYSSDIGRSSLFPCK